MKAYTDIEQSRKLAEILSLESADMRIGNYVGKSGKVDGTNVHYYPKGESFGAPEIIYAWSLAALLGALKIYTTPTAFSTNMSVPSLTKTKNGYSITYVGDYRIMESNNNDIESPIEIVADNPVDACVELILKLNELKML